VDSGIVYVGSKDKHLYAFDAQNGELKWKYETGDEVYSSPTIDNGIVYVSSGDDYLYALDAQTGKLKWKYQVGWGVSSPTVDSGIVYVGSLARYLYAINTKQGFDGITDVDVYLGLGQAYVALGEDKKAVDCYKKVIESKPNFSVSIYFLLIRLYARMGEKAKAIRTWNSVVQYFGDGLLTETRDLYEIAGVLWVHKIGAWVRSSPTVSNGIVYVGAHDKHLYAIDAKNGELKWKYETWDEVYSSPTVDNGIVYVGSNDDHLYAFDTQTGELRWKYRTEGNVGSSPAVSNGIVYVGAESLSEFGYKSMGADYHLYALDAQTGELKWKYKTGSWVFSSPTVDNGIVYFGSYDDHLYALDAQTGELRWKYDTGPVVFSSPTVDNGIIYVGSEDGHLYALDAKTGELRWKYDTEWSVRSSPTVSNGIVYVGSCDKHLYAIDAKTGELRWKYKMGEYTSSSPTVSNGIVYVGAKLWLELGHKSIGHLYAIDAKNGKLRWKYETEWDVTSSPIISNGIAYLGSWDGCLYAFDLAKIDKLLAKGQQWWFISEHDVLSCAQNISEESEKVRWLSSALQFCDYGGALQVGWEFLDLGKYSEARQIAEKLIELEPQNADGYKLLARLDYLKGKYEFAWLNNALQFCDDYRGILQIGREFLSLGRYSEARKVAEKLIELEPANSYFVDGYELLARIDYLEGKYESALKVSQKALELNPKLASAQYTIALIFVRQHQLEPAIKAYEKALKLDTAEILSAAITDLLDALKQEPSLSEAHFALGLLYETNQDYAKAKEHFTLYLQANVESKWAELAREHLKKINEK
jgi:outer membrane protein assembly factor BamB/Tfp pilus assembly protein PilF